MMATMMNSSMQSSSQKTNSMPKPVVAAYAVFGIVGFLVHHVVAGGEFSSILTLSVVVQCLGVSFLCLQVVTTKSVAGISAGALALDACSFGFRLSSTVWLDGYLPVDESGDHVYQIVDMCSLAMVLWLLYQVLVAKRSSYQESEDTLSVVPMIVGCFVLGGLFYGNMDARPLFDIFWMVGLLAGVLAVLPQLALVMKSGGRAEALTSHYIAALALARVLSGIFMWYARFDITCDEWVSGINHTVILILGAHLLHLILLSDFAYCYARSVIKNGLGEAVEFNTVDWV
eukprot:TRINITY_DN5568_c0_g5_i1.p1 TRINITY_DN5568_c0_g5~~TRINITY_DN5568_c0_g5_i1.p1  ORF type:complete len:287 (-),score=77.37 TRINITY_DN5568_c0_g5_i1:57-917(-)